MDESIQRQAAIVAQEGKYPPHTMRAAWLLSARQQLGDLDYFASRCKASEALEVKTARAALRNLVEFLERNP